jgi:signal transduction histidine kinase
MIPRIFRSIRLRLQLWHGLLLACALAGFGVMAFQLERTSRLQQVDRELINRIRDLHRALRDEWPRRPSRSGIEGEPPRHRPPPPPWSTRKEDSERELPPIPDPSRMLDGPLGEWVRELETAGFHWAIWGRDGRELKRSDSFPTGLIPPDSLPVESTPLCRTRGDRREAFLRTPPGELLFVGRSLTEELHVLRRLAVGLVAGGVGFLGVGLAVGWFLSTRAIRPVADIGETARRIAGGNLSDRIDTHSMDMELAGLADVLNETFGRLEATIAQQRQFTADASHELRTPVSVILSQVQTSLLRERSPTEYRDTLASCERAASRMRQLITALLELARLDGGQSSASQRESLDLAVIVRESMDLVSPLATARGLSFVEALVTVECIGDRAGLGQVLVNLLGNAIHYNREHGVVCVATRREGAHAIVEVRDTGIGMTPEELAQLFTRFFRADKSRSRAQGGAGLGLAIARAIIRSHGGEIDVESRAGEGSTFRVRLPAKGTASAGQ